MEFKETVNKPSKEVKWTETSYLWMGASNTMGRHTKIDLPPKTSALPYCKNEPSNFFD